MGNKVEKDTGLLGDSSDILETEACLTSLQKENSLLRAQIKKMQSELRLTQENKEDYHYGLKSSNACFCIIEMIFDEQGNPFDWLYLDTNVAFDNQYVQELKNAKGKYARDLLPDIDNLIKTYGEVALTGKSMHFFNESTEFGRWYDVFAFKIGNQQSRQVGVLYYDITDHVNTKQQTQFQAKLLDRVDDAIISVDQNNCVNYWNAAAENIFGWPAKEAIGRLLPDYILDYLNRCLRAIPPSPDDFSLQYAGMKSCRQDGSDLVLDMNCRILRDSQGNYLGALASCRDARPRIEELNKLQKSEMKAKELVEQLRQRDENKNRFISILSHELRNPIVSIMLSHSLLDRVGPDDPKAKKAYDIIKRQTGQLARLVDDLLDVTRLNSDKMALVKEKVDLNDLLERAIEDFKLRFAEKEVNLVPSLNSEPIYIWADPERINQVFSNLLHNAVKFTAKANSTWVQVSKDAANNLVEISIRDDGIGIDPEALGRLFDPFLQADISPERFAGGLGLGLTIAKGITDLHGGTLTAFSEGVGKGAEFIARLPLYQEENEQ